MLIKDKIITIIKNTFSLGQTDDVQQVLNRVEALSIPSLPRLLSELVDESRSSKQLAQTLEVVGIQIKLKVIKTPEEIEFLKQMTEIIIKPKYEPMPESFEESFMSIKK